MSKKNKIIIVTGATGQTGSYMCEYLLKMGYEVIAATRRTSQAIHSNLDECFKINNEYKLKTGSSLLRIEQFDLNDPHSIDSLIKKYKPSYFINLGAQTFVADSWNTPVNHFNCNAMGVLHCLESIRKHCPSTRFYNAGSSEEFGDVVTNFQDESHPLRPRSPYGAAKAASRHIVKVWRESYNIYAVQGILYNHESKKRQDYFVTRKITKHLSRIDKGLTTEPLELGNLNSRRDWTDARDMVKGIWLMLNELEPEDYVLASGRTRTIREFVDAVVEALGWEGTFWEGKGEGEELVVYDNSRGRMSPRVLVKINPDFYRPAEVELLCGDASKAKEELGWEPQISFEQMVEDMVEEDLK